jgi:hypothetical protein
LVKWAANFIKEAKAAALQLRSPPAVEAERMRKKEFKKVVNGQLPIDHSPLPIHH